MEEGISPYKIAVSAVLYSVCVIFIMYFVPELGAYAAAIASFSAGVYSGYCSKRINGMAGGFLAGLIGGVATGVIITGLNIPVSTMAAGFLQPVISSISPSPSLLSVTTFTVIGLFFGAIGGLFGSIKHLRPLFLLAILFFIFILLGAIDNAAWNILTPNWTWEMSFSHVLHNEIDVLVAVIFALFVTVLTFVMNMFKRYDK